MREPFSNICFSACCVSHSPPPACGGSPLPEGAYGRVRTTPHGISFAGTQCILRGRSPLDPPVLDNLRGLRPLIPPGESNSVFLHPSRDPHREYSRCNPVRDNSCGARICAANHRLPPWLHMPWGLGTPSPAGARGGTPHRPVSPHLPPLSTPLSLFSTPLSTGCGKVQDTMWKSVHKMCKSTQNASWSKRERETGRKSDQADTEGTLRRKTTPKILPTPRRSTLFHILPRGGTFPHLFPQLLKTFHRKRVWILSENSGGGARSVRFSPERGGKPTTNPKQNNTCAGKTKADSARRQRGFGSFPQSQHPLLLRLLPYSILFCLFFYTRERRKSVHESYL